MQFQRVMTNGGDTITVTRVEKYGINYRLSLDSGYRIVLPASKLAPDVLAMAR